MMVAYLNMTIAAMVQMIKEAAPSIFSVVTGTSAWKIPAPELGGLVIQSVKIFKVKRPCTVIEGVNRHITAEGHSLYGTLDFWCGYRG